MYGAGLGDNAAYGPLLSGDSRQTGWTLRGSNDGVKNDPGGIIPPTSPAGGNYFGADSVYDQGTLMQSVSGLVVGETYTFSFWWAAAQLGTGNVGGAASSGWNVTLGSATSNDASLSVSSPTFVSPGFTGWEQELITFTASSTSELLSVLPTGTGLLLLLVGMRGTNRKRRL